jgi:RNA polymerase sigma factor (sigma-70 family)
LIFARLFSWILIVGVENEVTSLTGIESSTENGGAVGFATTHWSLVLTAQGASPAADEALEELFRTYWKPVFSYLRLQGIRPEDAEDLTQGFFAVLLQRRGLDSVRKEKGRLRSYLLASLKNFLADEHRRAIAAKRGKRERLISFEELRDSRRIRLEHSDRLTADQIYDRRWAFTVLEQVLARLQEECRSAGNMRLFYQLKKLLTDEPGKPSQAQIASEFHMTENAVKQAFHRFRRRYQTLLRNEIARTVERSGDVEDELRHLIAALRA